MAQQVVFISAGPGDPELITLKARRLLGQARVCVYSGSLIAPEILSHLGDEVERHDSSGMTLGEIVAVFRRAKERDEDAIRRWRKQRWPALKRGRCAEVN